MATVKLKNGEITLYQRPDSENWYAGFRMAQGGRKQESLRTSNKELAVERALERYTTIHLHHKLGLTDSTVSFDEAADAWLEELAAEVAAGTRKARTLIDYKLVVERYLKPYFGKSSVDGISHNDVAKYRAWRRDYWLTGTGSKINSLEYERSGAAESRKFTRPGAAPAPSTINGENVVLRGVFKHAITQGWMTAAQMPNIKNQKIKVSEARQRAYPFFEFLEFKKLRIFMKEWAVEEGITVREQWRRQAIRHFVLIMIYSGLREHELLKRDEKTGEMRGLRWRDVSFFQSAKGVDRVDLHVSGKTGERHVIAQKDAPRAFVERRLLCPDHTPNDFVLAYPDGTCINGFDSGIQRLLELTGLKKCPRTGKNRGIYSFRHSYATWRIQAGRDAFALAQNMGTSVKMIEQSYYHHM